MVQVRSGALSQITHRQRPMREEDPNRSLAFQKARKCRSFSSRTTTGTLESLNLFQWERSKETVIGQACRQRCPGALNPDLGGALLLTFHRTRLSLMDIKREESKRSFPSRKESFLILLANGPLTMFLLNVKRHRVSHSLNLQGLKRRRGLSLDHPVSFSSGATADY